LIAKDLDALAKKLNRSKVVAGTRGVSRELSQRASSLPARCFGCHFERGCHPGRRFAIPAAGIPEFDERGDEAQQALAVTVRFIPNQCRVHIGGFGFERPKPFVIPGKDDRTYGAFGNRQAPRSMGGCQPIGLP